MSKATYIQLRRLARALVGTDDDLEIGQAELGIDPAIFEIDRRELAAIGRIRQCDDCAVWFPISRKTGCPNCED